MQPAVRFLRQHAIAVLALVVALSGTAYAATALPKHSVGAKQLKRNAVTGKAVKDGSLTAADLVAGTIPAPTPAPPPAPALAVSVELDNTGATVQQVTTSNVLLPITFERATVNSGGMWSASSPDRFTVPRAGIYAVDGAVSFEASTAGPRRIAICSPFNSVSVGALKASTFVHGDGTNGQAVIVHALVSLQAGDTIGLLAYQQSGGALDIEGNTGSYKTVFSAAYVGSAG